MARKQPNAKIFDKIFELKWAEPFKPFALKTADGQRYVIARCEAIGRSPSGKIIAFYAKGEGGHRMLPITQIVAVSPVRSTKARSTRAKGSSPRSNGSSKGLTHR